MSIFVVLDMSIFLVLDMSIFLVLDMSIFVVLFMSICIYIRDYFYKKLEYLVNAAQWGCFKKSSVWEIVNFKKCIVKLNLSMLEMIKMPLLFRKNLI